MRIRPALCVLLTAALTRIGCTPDPAACAACTDSPPTADTSTGDGPPAAPDTPADTAAPPDVEPQTSEPVDNCRISRAENAAVGVGFPQAPDRLQTTGRVRVAVLFAQFADVTASRTPEQLYELLTPGAAEFFAETSYGRLELELVPHLQWLDLADPAAAYAERIRTYFGHREFLAEAVMLADPDVDFADMDLVLVISTPDAAEIGYGPTWMGTQGAPLEADGVRITNGITSGADLLFWEARWLNHEMGHSMGLPDLYSFEFDGGYARPFSVMDYIGSSAPGYLGWERWQLGWLDDDAVLCNPSTGTWSLRPLQEPDGVRVAILRTGPTRALAIEYRTASGVDRELAAPGVVVTRVDASVATGQGPMEVLNDRAALEPGAEISVDGVRIRFDVVSSTGAARVEFAR